MGKLSVFTKLATFAGKVKVKAIAKSPELWFTAGCVALIGAVVASGKSRMQFEEILEENDGDSREDAVTCATGVLAAPLIRELADMLSAKFPNISVTVYAVRNAFFGETVTVAGLTTASDLIAALTPHIGSLGSRVLIPKAMLKADEDIFLDDITLSEVSEKLGVPVIPVGEEPEDLLSAFIKK